MQDVDKAIAKHGLAAVVRHIAVVIGWNGGWEATTNHPRIVNLANSLGVAAAELEWLTAHGATFNIQADAEPTETAGETAQR